MRFIYYCLLLMPVCINLELKAQCSADFNYTPLNFHSFQFNASGVANSYSWNFGDGDTSNLQNPNHTFSDTGLYNICLHSLFSNSCIADTCFSIHVDSCQAYFTYVYDPTLLQPQQPIYFFYDSSFGEQSGTTYLWSFGTGDYSIQKDQALVYETDDAGPENVCLTITNPGNGCVSTYCKTIVVDALCGADTFAYTTQGNTVNFTSWICGYWTHIDWDFGDGTSATQTDVASHAYTSSGDSFYVCLTVNFDSVCRDAVPCTAIYCAWVNLRHTSIEDISPLIEAMSVFCNEEGTELTVAFPQNNDQLKLELVDVTGKVLSSYSFTGTTVRLDIANLSSGFYLVHVGGLRGKNTVARFIKP